MCRRQEGTTADGVLAATDAVTVQNYDCSQINGFLHGRSDGHWTEKIFTLNYS